MGILAPVTGAIGGAIKGFSNGGLMGGLKGLAGGAVSGLTGGAIGGNWGGQGVGQAAQTAQNALGGFGNYAQQAMGGLAQAGNIYQGYQDQRAQSANLEDQRQQFDMIRQMIQNQMGQNVAGTGEQGLEALLRGGGGGPNQSQDGLSQSLRMDGANMVGAAGSNLAQIAEQGGINIDELMAAQQAQQGSLLEQQLAAQKAGVSGLGQAAGTAAQFAQGRIRNQNMQDTNLLNAQTVFGARTDAANRRIQASGQLGNLGLGTQQMGLEGADQQMRGYSQLAQMQNSRLGQNAGLIGMMMQNQAPGRQMGSPMVDALTNAPFLSMIMQRVGQRPGMQPGMPAASMPMGIQPTGGFAGGTRIPTNLFQGMRL